MFIASFSVQICPDHNRFSSKKATSKVRFRHDCTVLRKCTEVHLPTRCHSFGQVAPRRKLDSFCPAKRTRRVRVKSICWPKSGWWFGVALKYKTYSTLFKYQFWEVDNFDPESPVERDQPILFRERKWWVHPSWCASEADATISCGFPSAYAVTATSWPKLTKVDHQEKFQGCTLW